MNKKPSHFTDNKKNRLLSLDVMRGLIMLLLAAEACGIYESISKFNLSHFQRLFINQFFHHPWHGLRFWDLVQPSFMFMAGTGMYFSYLNKINSGKTWHSNFNHILKRCFYLFLLGLFIQAGYNRRLVWELWNVLTQLSFTTLIAYLIISKSYKYQLLVSFLLLIITEILYRFTSISGYNFPFVESRNFGTWMDQLVMGKINSDGWVMINFLPTAAHTIWGCLTGKLLSSKNILAKSKLIYLTLAGFAMLLTGYILDASQVTPIIKRISTTSFVLVSGGWVILILSFLYWLVDVKKFNKSVWLLSVIGLNSIFCYVLFSVFGGQIRDFANIFTNWLINRNILSNQIVQLINGIIALFLIWYLCYWLYKKHVFFKV